MVSHYRSVVNTITRAVAQQQIACRTDIHRISSGIYIVDDILIGYEGCAASVSAYKHFSSRGTIEGTSRNIYALPAGLNVTHLVFGAVGFDKIHSRQTLLIRVIVAHPTVGGVLAAALNSIHL